MTDATGRMSEVVHVRDTLLADRGSPAAPYARATLAVDVTTPAQVVRRVLPVSAGTHGENA